MKPNGMTVGMQITRSTPAEDAVWEAVKLARSYGWTVERFRRECAEAWREDQKDDMLADEEAWSK